MFHGLGGMRQVAMDKKICAAQAWLLRVISLAEWRYQVSPLFFFYLFSFFDILLMVVANNSIINYMLNKQSNI